MNRLHGVVKFMSVLLLLVFFVGTGGWAYRSWRYHSVSAVQRGRLVADRLGCFTCHGPGGIAGIRNPTDGESMEEYVPPWDGRRTVTNVHNEAEILQWILNGAPDRIRKDPAAASEMAKHHIKMPAFRGMLNQSELNDLVVFYKAVSWFDPISDDNAKKGREAASRYDCFSCHGPEGKGLIKNPRSFMGYIPPWTGSDFKELVKNDAELDDWILKGHIARLDRHPVAGWFLRRQAIQMPAYDKFMCAEDLAAIKAYIAWVRGSKE